MKQQRTGLYVRQQVHEKAQGLKEEEGKQYMWWFCESKSQVDIEKEWKVVVKAGPCGCVRC